MSDKREHMDRDAGRDIKDDLIEGPNHPRPDVSWSSDKRPKGTTQGNKSPK